MKTTLFFGQPKCLSFGNVQEMLSWLEVKERSRTVTKACVSLEMGSDGSRRCDKRPPAYRLRMPAARSTTGEDVDCVSCSNHVQSYLMKGWVQLAKLCENCSSEAALGWTLCESCLDKASEPRTEAQRLKDAGYCV